MEKQYIAIDLKSYYASVECNERGLDPLTTNLVVADLSRTEKTICLAVSPSLKSFGIPGRPRLFEVIQKVGEVNKIRRRNAPNHCFTGKSSDFTELQQHPELELDFIVATPRMAYYIEYSTIVYEVYLRYIAAEDIHVYSIDEVFIDATGYLKTYNMTAHELAMTIVRDVLATTGITATAGIGTNMYLCKIAMDIVAKKMPADKDGVRIAELNETSYRELLWDHRPLTSFWRVGHGIAAKLEANGMYTMGDVARMSLTQYGEDRLYKLFGVNAELLIDHAWGWEPVTIADIKAYKPESDSLSSGQVLSFPYTFEKARIIVREMTDSLVYDLIEKKLVTDQVVLTIGYDIENLRDPKIANRYHGEITSDHYGRPVPKHAHGTQNLIKPTSAGSLIEKAVMELFDRVVDRNLLVRRINVCVARLIPENEIAEDTGVEQLSLCTDYAALQRKREMEKAKLDRERRRQEAILAVRKRYGKNAVLRGLNYEDGATARERNEQIGGHKK